MDSSPIISGKDRTSQSDKNTNSYKTGSALDFAAKKLHRGPARQDFPRAAAASSNELQNLPHPEHHQTQPAEIQEPDRIQQKDILLKKLYTDAYKLAHYISNIRTFCITFHSYQIPEDYNPYYSMNNVKDKGRINIDFQHYPIHLVFWLSDASCLSSVQISTAMPLSKRLLNLLVILPKKEHLKCKMHFKLLILITHL